MNSRKRSRLLIGAFLVFCIFTLLAGANVALAARPTKAKCPDFTKGDNIPEGWNHDWTLGPTGMRGWIYCDKHTTTDSRQIKVMKVEKGSPADGIIKVGDVILGVHGKPFDDDARILFGKAITKAEKTENQGNLPLTIWRNGKTSQMTIRLEVMGSYSLTAPFNCPKSKKILEKGCEALAKKMKANPTGGPLIARALNATLLLASGNPKYLPVVREQAKLLSQYNQSSGVRTWNYGFVNIFLAEYVLATGDRIYVNEGLKRITKMAVDGQSKVGSWGHSFVDPKTRILSGYGMMNSPGLLLTYSMVLARRAGVNVPGLDKAINKSITLLEFYVGKGAIPYGDHNPWIQTHDDNGKCGLAAVLFDHEGNKAATEFYSRMSVADHGVRRDEGHTGNFFNMTWALPGVMRSGPNAGGAWLKEFGWYYDLARRWDGTFLYQGAPEPRNQVYNNWESTGSYLLGFTYPLKKTYLTGRKASAGPAVDRSTAESLVNDGRGWTNKDRNSFYDSLTTKQLLQRLSSWSPTVRERTAMALARRKDDVTPQLIRLLDGPDLYTKYGVCQALKMQRGRGAAAVPALLKTFRSDDLWLRILTAEALAGIGEPAKVAVGKLLERFVKTDSKKDPRKMEQRYLCFSLFNKRGGLLGRSLEGVDRKLLIEVVRHGLKNEDGRARGCFGLVYKNLTFDEIKPLLPDIYQAIVKPAPSGIMFASGIRLAGLELLSKNKIKEGLPLCLEVTEIQKWGKKNRVLSCLKSLRRYGPASVKTVLPQLKQLEKDVLKHREAKTVLKDSARLIREIIEEAETATGKPDFIPLKNFLVY